MKWPVSLVAGAVLSVLFVVVALLSFVWTPHDVATLANAYPVTLGANVGTTVTAVLGARVTKAV